MKLKTIIKVVVIVSVVTLSLGILGGCGAKAAVKIAVPSDPTNEARALLLLQDQGLITLKDGVGLAATKNDIKDNPHNIEIVEIEAASTPTALPDVDAAAINGNYAISANIDTSTALAKEDSSSQAAQQYSNVVAVRAQDEKSEKTKALIAALQSKQVQQYITDTYKGAVVPTGEPSNENIPEATGDNKLIKIGASPAPHAEILAQAKDILASHGYTLEIKEYSDYIQPNVALNDGDLDANYFQHTAYLDDYNAENNTNLVSAGSVHFEALGLYPGKTKSLDDLKK